MRYDDYLHNAAWTQLATKSTQDFAAQRERGAAPTIRVVAEAGQCPQGQVDLAIRMAQAAHDAGAWGFKTQLLTPETIAAPDAPKYWDDGFGTTNQREAFTRAGLIDYGAWSAVKEACDDIGIEFLATPFDLPAVEALHAMGVRYYKVASGDITYRDLIRACDEAGQVILSTGASWWWEIDRAVQWAPDATLLACTLSYPTPLDQAHLGRIDSLRRRFPIHPVGYSDHTSWKHTAMVAAAMGASMLEVHYTHDRAADDVPDHAMALDPAGLAEYVSYALAGVALRGEPGLVPCKQEDRARRGARRSAHAARDLPAGHRLSSSDVVWLRPDGPVEPWVSVDSLVLTEPVKAGEQIHL